MKHKPKCERCRKRPPTTYYGGQAVCARCLHTILRKSKRPDKRGSARV